MHEFTRVECHAWMTRTGDIQPTNIPTNQNRRTNPKTDRPINSPKIRIESSVVFHCLGLCVKGNKVSGIVLLS